MKINLIIVGKIREKYLREGMAEYIKRLGSKLKVIEVGYEKIPKVSTISDEDRVRLLEGERLLKHIRSNAYTVVLDMKGMQMTSQEFAEMLKNVMLEGKSEINFVIGGPLGLSDKVRERADLIFSLSKMTFPHQMASFIMVEQIYRALNILSGGKYHK